MQSLYRLFRNSRLSTYFASLSENLENQRLNRQLIGSDRFGNKYYQYYSFYGLPTRREIWFKNSLDFTMKDLVYYAWLHHQVYDPPTAEEKQQFYLQEQLRHERALEWDTKDDLNMIEFRRKRKEILLRNQALQELEAQMNKDGGALTDIKTKRNDS